MNRISKQKAQMGGRLRKGTGGTSSSDHMILRPRVQRSRSALERYQYQDEVARMGSLSHQAWTRTQRARKMIRHGVRMAGGRVTQSAFRGTGTSAATGIFMRGAMTNPMTGLLATATYALTVGLLNYAGSSEAQASEKMNEWFFGNVDDDQRARNQTMEQAKSNPELMAWLGQMKRSGKGERGMAQIHTIFSDVDKVNRMTERGKSLMRQQWPELTQGDMLARRMFQIISEGDYSPLEHLANETEALFMELYRMLKRTGEEAWGIVTEYASEAVDSVYKRAVPVYNTLKKNIGID